MIGTLENNIDFLKALRDSTNRKGSVTIKTYAKSSSLDNDLAEAMIMELINMGIVKKGKYLGGAFNDDYLVHWKPEAIKYIVEPERLEKWGTISITQSEKKPTSTPQNRDSDKPTATNQKTSIIIATISILVMATLTIIINYDKIIAFFK